jgi:hypothetical protein
MGQKVCIHKDYICIHFLKITHESEAEESVWPGSQSQLTGGSPSAPLSLSLFHEESHQFPPSCSSRLCRSNAMAALWRLGTVGIPSFLPAPRSALTPHKHTRSSSSSTQLVCLVLLVESFTKRDFLEIERKDPGQKVLYKHETETSTVVFSLCHAVFACIQRKGKHGMYRCRTLPWKEGLNEAQ